MPQNEELSQAMQEMKRELLAAIAAVDARVGRVEANVNLLCETLLAPDEKRALRQIGGSR